jgi:hypothetical protein
VDGLAGGDLRRQLRDPLRRRPAAESAVRAVVVVEGPPALEPRGEGRALRVDRRPEPLQRGALDALDLAVEVRRAGPVGPELDPPVPEPVPEPVPDLVGEELLAAVGLCTRCTGKGIPAATRSRKSRVSAAVRRG